MSSPFSLAIVIGIVCALTGAAIELLLKKNNVREQITKVEYLVGVFIIIPVCAFLLTLGAWELAKLSKTTFNEYWNGWEIGVTETTTKCVENGSCFHTYTCGSHQEWDSCDSRNSDNECQGGWDTVYDYCPYYKSESNYYVQTSFGRYTFGKHHATNNERYDSQPIPSFENIPVGPPQDWLEVQARILSDNPGPVVVRKSYQNYIYASDETILLEYSEVISSLLSVNMLPLVSKDVFDHYSAEKVYFVGWEPQNISAWNHYVTRLDAALGMELHGDLHLVILKDYVGSPEEYLSALKAYWQSTEYFGKDTVAKNAVVVVLNTNGEKVLWARATTGMPYGNATLAEFIQAKLKDVPFNPEGIIGSIDSSIVINKEGEKEVVTNKIGETYSLTTLLWDETSGFVRMSMSGKDPDDVGGGMAYLSKEIQPANWQKILIVCLITPILSAGVWGIFIITGTFRYKKRYQSRYYYG